jgi:hypothetical protein
VVAELLWLPFEKHVFFCIENQGRTGNPLSDASAELIGERRRDIGTR